jgi:hypothetical protein
MVEGVNRWRGRTGRKGGGGGGWRVSGGLLSGRADQVAQSAEIRTRMFGVSLKGRVLFPLFGQT